DRVLCDVPCSGLGVIRRKPEIKYKNTEDFDRLSEIQYEILETSSKYLKSGGVLVYSTCTLSKAENEDIVNRFLKEHSDFKGVAVNSNYDELSDYCSTIIPEYFNSDGFFIARFKRN
ncbi:MAG: 16S rRNA (cytosine(967)-C(5))-methyltransferase RsmB, partial [Oscillospiraceae bacterium]|nr:16S rRNA (cytosine(967)-C(5))-methyltransferase RsmB [Oscillospiraceae bacterium]